MHHRLVMILALLLVPSMAPAAAAEPPPTLTVGLCVRRDAVVVEGTRGLAVLDGGTGARLFSKLNPPRLTFSVDMKGFLIEGFGVRSRVRVEAIRGGHLLVDGKPYRGSFVVEEDRFGKITVINVIDVESYLYGVVKSEMLITSPPAALQAQAVIARTFALKHRDRYTATDGFGLTADTSTQVYAGIEGEDPRATAAVDATRGTVLQWRGELIESYYHSACGGWTLNNEDAWGGAPLPYLRGVRCGYCADSANFAWRVELPYDTILARLLEQGHRLGSISGFETRTASESGQVILLIVKNDLEDLRILGNMFRLAIGASVIRSAFFTVPDTRVAAAVPDGFSGPARDGELEMRNLIGSYLAEVNPARTLVVEGCGSGHGVGLCQSGARGLAQLGKTFKDVLAFYYRDVTIGQLYR